MRSAAETMRASDRGRRRGDVRSVTLTAYIVSHIVATMAYAVIPGPLPANRISPRGRRWAGGVAALVVLGACAPDSDTDRPMAAVRVAAETTDLGFAPGSLEWSSCGGRLECATLEVPLDYDDPTGPMISVAVAMYPARGPEARVGVLVTNPGGPGNSGIDFISGGGPFNDEINRRFDVVSWDPRGVGRSEPLRCGAEIAELFLTSDLAPVDAVGRATLARAARGTAVKCGEANGALLEHVGTDDAVNVEAIRLALGGEPLTYVGFSYGTRIGLRYAERFPTSLRAMAIDGVVDPEHALADQMTTTALGIDRSLAEVLAACGTDCPIDGDPLTAFRVLVEQTRTEPLHTDDGREVDPNAVVLAGMAVTYDESFNTRSTPRSPKANVASGTSSSSSPTASSASSTSRPPSPSTASTCPTRPPSTTSSARPPRQPAKPPWCPGSSAATSAPSHSPASTGQPPPPTPSSP